MIYGGTSPVHTFKLPVDIGSIKSVRVLYAQDERVVLTKDTTACNIMGNVISVKLTQEDTLAFNCKYRVEIQLHVMTVEGEPLVSKIKNVSVGRCLDKDVIE